MIDSFRLLTPRHAAEERALAAVRPSIPFERALLCLDCNSVYESEGALTCPACGSAAAWLLARALDREPSGMLKAA